MVKLLKQNLDRIKTPDPKFIIRYIKSENSNMVKSINWNELLRERSICPLCASSHYSVFIDFAEIPVYKCLECDFIYSGKLLDRQELTRYYQEGFGSQRHKQGQLINSLVNLSALEKLLQLSQVNSLLDVGTGYGFLLKELTSHYDINCKGVELSKQEANFAINVLGQEVSCCTLNDAGLPKEHFDVITCFEVIEHLPTPREFVGELASYVRPGGKMVIMTDNFESAVCRTLGPEFPKWIPHSHISHFSPKLSNIALNRSLG